MAETILSVGIDIGTSTTSLIFSNLTIESTTGDTHLPKTEITDKTVVYRSPVHLTPLRSNSELDAEKIRRIVETEYLCAGIEPESVQTGAVIITGDTARKVNAQNVLSEISRFAGDFVVATAGPDLESLLAGKGSGAEQYSVENVETICNLDVGGGTTNMATFYDGKCIDTDCLDVGGRLIRFKTGTMEIEYIFPKLKELARRIGIPAETGVTLTPSAVVKLADLLAEAVMGKVDGDSANADFHFLRTEKKAHSTPPEKIDTISFSGGVGKLIYEEELSEKLAYDDIGIYLADSLRKAVRKRFLRVVRPRETIGATVIGAGSHSVDVSGGTITITQIQKLPLKNVPILQIDRPLECTEEELTLQIEGQGYRSEQEVALNLNIGHKMKYRDIAALSEKLVRSMKKLMERQDVIVIVVYGDYGKVLGQSISARLPQGKEVICIDSVDAGNGDYIDIGRPVGIADSVPVVIKTIAFSY